MLGKLISQYRNTIKKKNVIIQDLPKVYGIEPINVCNLKCPTCNTLRINTKRKYLKTEDFKKIADQIPSDSTIYFFLWGEPFLNPDAFEIIKMAKEYGFNFIVDSNLNLDPELIPKIVDAGIDHLQCSIDGTSQETYEKFRIGGNFNLAFENFRKIAILKEEQKKTFRLTWQFIVNKYNENDIPKIKELAKDLPHNFDIIIVKMGLRHEYPLWEQTTKDELNKLKSDWLPNNKFYILNYLKRKNRKYILRPHTCPSIFNSMLINVYGDVMPCCYTYLSDFKFGNINENTLQEIWNNEKYQSARKYFLDSKTKSSGTICDHCHNYLKNGDSFLSRNKEFFCYLFERIELKLLAKFFMNK